MIIYWTKTSTGNFTTTGDWSTGTIPGALDQVRIDASGTPTVTSSADETVLSVATDIDAALDITGGIFQMSEGTGIGANDGQFDVGDSAELVAGGTIDNKGNIYLQSTGDATQLLTITNASLTLTGGGYLTMSDQAENTVDITTNVNNFISGAGTVNLSNNEKNGDIVASGTNYSLAVNDAPNLTLINAGILGATDGELLLFGTIDDSSGGVIQAIGADALVYLASVTVIGGKLLTTGGGAISLLGTGSTTTLDGIKATVNNAAALVFGDSTLALEGTINNTVSITLELPDSDLAIDAAGATLEGNGAISLDNNDCFIISNAASAKLTNVNNTISGSGLIGDSGSNTMTLTNKGIIDGTLVAGGTGPLIIDTGSNAVINSGTLEAALGELYIASSVTNSGKLIAESGGDLVAAGSVTGGSATIEGTGTVEFGAASNVGTSFAAGSTGRLILDDGAQYTGTISGFGANTTQSIDLPNVQFATLSETYSGGTLTVKDTSGDIAKIKFSGSYKLTDFSFTNDGGGGTLITDPPVASKTSGVNIALLGNYIASSLAGGSVGQGGSLPTDPWAIVSPHLLATPAHA